LDRIWKEVGNKTAKGRNRSREERRRQKEITDNGRRGTMETERKRLKE
jgi:hypothetical protein